MPQTDYENECMELARYPELSIKAQALWCYTHRKDKAAMETASVFFANNPKHMARAVAMFPEMFEADEARDLYLYLSAFKIASLPVHARALLAAQWQDTTMSFGEVREAVDAYKKRKSKEEKEQKLCPHCKMPL